MAEDEYWLLARNFAGMLMMVSSTVQEPERRGDPVVLLVALHWTVFTFEKLSQTLTSFQRRRPQGNDVKPLSSSLLIRQGHRQPRALLSSS